MKQTNKIEEMPHRAAPPLTEIERLKLENFALKYQAMQAQSQQLLAERAGFIQQIVAARPGFTWDDKLGLVPAPAEA
jgi:hypothetical protein